MVAFYGDTLGLTRLPGGAWPGLVFFQLGGSFGGHTQVLALFAHDGVQRDAHPAAAPEAGAGSTLHHIALALPYAEQAAAAEWLAARGHEARFQNFPWVGWRGLFTRDPDGNTVELVAAVPDGPAP